MQPLIYIKIHFNKHGMEDPVIISSHANFNSCLKLNLLPWGKQIDWGPQCKDYALSRWSLWHQSRRPVVITPFGLTCVWFFCCAWVASPRPLPPSSPVVPVFLQQNLWSRVYLKILIVRSGTKNSLVFYEIMFVIVFTTARQRPLSWDMNKINNLNPHFPKTNF